MLRHAGICICLRIPPTARAADSQTQLCYDESRAITARYRPAADFRIICQAMNLKAYLKANNAEFEFVQKNSTHRASDAAHASGIPLDKIAKTIVFSDSCSRIIVAVVRGDHMVSRHKLETCAGYRRLKITPDAEAEGATGFPTGGIPPVGHRKHLPVYVDIRVTHMNHVWCGGGSRTRLVRLKTDDLLRLSHAKVCDIALAS